MPALPTEAVTYEIEPELRTLPPRPTRLRPAVAAVMRQQWRTLILTIFLMVLMYAVLLAALSLPDWFGQVVLARVTYQGNVFYSRSRGGPSCALRLARLTYDWRGMHHEDTVTVSADLPSSFPDDSAVPVKVLRPWRVRVWTKQTAFSAHRFQQFLWEAFGVILLPLVLAVALSRNFAWAGGRGRPKLVSRGTPVVGYIVSRPDQSKLPRYGPVPVVFSYVDPTAADLPHPEDSMLRGVQKIPVQLMALLPSVGQPVTVLLLPNRFALPQLYAVNLYEAVLLVTGSALASTPTPRPKTG